jgi:hypothetical protein
VIAGAGRTELEGACRFDDDGSSGVTDRGAWTKDMRARSSESSTSDDQDRRDLGRIAVSTSPPLALVRRLVSTHGRSSGILNFRQAVTSVASRPSITR